MQLRWQIAADGWIVLALFGMVTIILGAIHAPLGTFALGLMIWMTYILRVPARLAPANSASIVAPADGQIIAIATVPFPGAQFPGDVTNSEAMMATRITIKTGFADAHLQVVPQDGRIEENFLIPGLFLDCGDVDAMRTDNERREIVIETTTGDCLVIVQYGGRFARQLVCEVGTGKFVNRGTALGMIRMAGVTDIYLPTALDLSVAVGQSTLGGETILATTSGMTPASQMV